MRMDITRLSHVLIAIFLAGASDPVAISKNTSNSIIVQTMTQIYLKVWHPFSSEARAPAIHRRRNSLAHCHREPQVVGTKRGLEPYTQLSSKSLKHWLCMNPFWFG